MFPEIEKRFRQAAPAGEYCSLRVVRERYEILSVRQNVPQPVQSSEDLGGMVTVAAGGGVGYAATADLSAGGIQRAIDEAADWARRTAGVSLFAEPAGWTHPTGEYVGPVASPWESTSLADKLDLLVTQGRRLRLDERIVDWEASLWGIWWEQLQLTGAGGRVAQQCSFVVPFLRATANEGADTQTRSLGGRGYCRQGGLEVLTDIGYSEQAPRIGEEAIELLLADNCPSGTMDVLLAPDQMILQIHESIGHPLELDRILGDERNYAGTSFVTPDMFGSYRYGSELLNVTYDPTRGEQFASFGYDDDGSAAEKTWLIEEGILQRPLGGAISQARAEMPGVANSRACSWNRPPIDRMANLNLEPGASSMSEMVASIERGVCMKTNCSWSIDDSRNKFQFGCEWARRIEDGEMKEVLKNPNYRGISATFWRNLRAVGDESTMDVMGTPFCGKGEPNQCIRVGHASPACVFAGVDVFGGE
jgi:predicted Zn-dependent protease